MISINATLILQVIHFLILVFILNRLMLKPILKVTHERAEHLDNRKREIQNIEEETDRLKKEYLSIKETARREAIQERSQLRNLGMAETEEAIDGSRKEVSSIRVQADKRADEEAEKARPALFEEAEMLAEEIIEAVIGRRIAG